jgi:hypothetical protein
LKIIINSELDGRQKNNQLRNGGIRKAYFQISKTFLAEHFLNHCQYCKTNGNVHSIAGNNTLFKRMFEYLYNT